MLTAFALLLVLWVAAWLLTVVAVFAFTFLVLMIAFCCVAPAALVTQAVGGFFESNEACE